MSARLPNPDISLQVEGTQKQFCRYVEAYLKALSELWKGVNCQLAPLFFSVFSGPILDPALTKAQFACTSCSCKSDRIIPTNCETVRKYQIDVTVT